MENIPIETKFERGLEEDEIFKEEHSALTQLFAWSEDLTDTVCSNQECFSYKVVTHTPRHGVLRISKCEAGRKDRGQRALSTW